MLRIEEEGWDESGRARVRGRQLEGEEEDSDRRLNNYGAYV